MKVLRYTSNRNFEQPSIKSECLPARALDRRSSREQHHLPSSRHSKARPCAAYGNRPGNRSNPQLRPSRRSQHSASITAEQSSTAGSASSPSTADSAANKADATPDVSESQASGSSNSAGHATTSSSKANAGESADISSLNKAPSQSADSAEPANQASSTKADTVSATLKISVYGTTLVSHTFSIEKGKTVKDLLDLAASQGYIGAIDPEKDLNTYDDGLSHFIKFLTINGNAFGNPVTPNAYWISNISANGASRNDAGIEHDTIDCDNYTYTLNLAKYPDDGTKYDNGTGDYPTSPNAPHPDKATSSDTTSYVKSEGNTSVVTSAPTSSNNAALSWKKAYGNGNYSEILTLGDSIYFASSLLNANWTPKTAVLHRLNSKGEETASLQLFGTIDASACRMAYTDGVIIIPLSNGRLQGVSATEMKTLWVSGAIASGAQNISTVTASGGMVFTGTANSLDSSYNAATGTFFGINAITGERVWANEEANTGFYWSGACKVGNVLLYGNDAGVLTAVDPATGKTVSALKLSSAIRSTVISNNAETETYVTTNDGTLHKISVAPNGSLSELSTASFDSKSTSTATLFQGNLFVGGCAADYTGTLSVIDAATMQVKHSTSLPFEVKSAPLVAKAADGNTYAYFTCNGAEGTWPNYTSGGGAWVYCLETNTATKLFDATGSMANWCTKSIVMGADGTLYWTNDSGTLFALANAASSSNGNDSDSTQTPEKPGTNNQQNNKAPDSNPSEHALAATPISAGDASAAAQAPLSDAEALAENKASNEGSAVTSASSARGTSSNNGNDSKGAPWLPIAGIVAGCAGLVAVGAFLFRRRSL